jgi:hypothetical protein
LKQKDYPKVQAPSFMKYGFRIRTRVGLVIDSLSIHGRDENEAQRKLRQMYPGCEVLECVCHSPGTGGRALPSSFEDIVSLITR